MKAKRLPPPRVAELAAPRRLEPAEVAVEQVRRARRELQDAQANLCTAEAEQVEKFARYERARDEAQEAIDAEAAAGDRFMRATEGFTAALARAQEHGLAAQLLLERDRLYFIDDQAEDG